MGAARAGDPRAAPPPEARPKGRSLALNSSAVFAITVVIQLIGYIPTFFLARGLGSSTSGQALFGTIQTFMLLASSVSSIGDLRIGSAFTFFVSRGDSPKRATPTYLTIRMLMVGGAGLVLWAFSPEFGISTTTTLELFGIWMVLPLLWSTSTVYVNLWTSLGDSARGQYPQLLESVVRAGALAYVAIVVLDPLTGHGALNPTLTLWSMTEAYLLGAVVSAAYSLPSLFRYRGRPSSSEAARLFRWSLPLLGSMALLYLSGNLVNFVVIYYLKQAQFNIFNAANAFRTLALALPAAIAIPLFPHISSLHKERAFSEIRTRTWQALRYTAMLVIPGVIALVIYRVNFLLILYQKTYIPGAPALAILAVSAIPAALSQIIATTLTSIGRTRLEFYITSLQVACLSIVSILLVQPPAQLGWLNGWGVTGLNGAAMAVLVSSLAALLLNTYFMLTLLGIRIQVTSLVMITASAGASFFAISRLNEYLPVNRYYQLAAAVILGFAVYLAVLSLTGELSKSDVRRVSRSLGLSPRSSEFLARLCWKESAREVNAVPPSGAKGLAPVESEWEEPPTPRSPPEGPTPPLP